MSNEMINAAIKYPNVVKLLRPSPQLHEGSKAPSNSEVRKVANEVLGAMKYSYAISASNLSRRFKSDSLETVFQKSIKSRPDFRQAKIKKIGNSLVSTKKNVRKVIFGKLGNFSPERYLQEVGDFDRVPEMLPAMDLDFKLMGFPHAKSRKSIAKDHLPQESDIESSELEVQPDDSVIDGIHNGKADDIWGPITSSDLFTEGEYIDDDFEQFAVTDKMGFFISRVKCVDETNPEIFGSDEIALAGISIDETGDTKKINERYIGGGFDDGDRRVYVPNWKYHWFNMHEGSSWPKTYKVSLLLAEKDHGGLSGAIDKIWKKVKKAVYDLIKKAAEAAGKTIGAFLGSSQAGAVIGRVIGEAVSWVIDKFFGWIVDIFKDDIFPMYTATVTTPSMRARWYYPNGKWGNPQSGIRTAHFYGHGGHYTIDYYWRFYA